jgi:hypothetical protein
MKKIPSICMAKKCYALLATGMVWGMSAGLALAAASANDSASNYVSVWGTSPPNNGTGFGNWGFNGGPSSGMYNTFLAGISDTPIVDGGGNAWALSANSVPISGYLAASRAFTPGPSASASLYNQTLSFDMAVSGVPSPSPSAPPGYFEVTVGSLSFGFQEDGSLAPYTYLDNTTSNTLVDPAISLSQWNAGLAVSISVSGALNSSAENYTLTVSPFSGGGPIFSNSGTFDSSRFVPSAVTFLDYGFGGYGYFNSLNITPEPAPEPSMIGLMGIGLAGVWRGLKWRR